MELSVVQEDPGELAILCTGEIDRRIYIPDPLADLLGPEGYGRKVLLDLSGVTFLGSNGVGWLVRCHNSFQDAGGRFVIHSIPEFIDKILELLCMHAVLEIERDPATAGERLKLPRRPKANS